MPKLKWNGDDFRKSKDSSGATADQVSNSGKLQQGYRHGSLTYGMVAYYPIEEGGGEVLHDGALDNLGQFDGGNWSNTTVIGNQSYDFSGASSGVVVKDSPELRVASTKTLSVWFNSNQTDEGVLLMKGEGGNPIDFFFAIDSDGTLIYGQQDSSSYDSFNTTETFNDGNWHHALARVKNNNAEIWVNGNLKASKTMQNSAETTKNMAIGSRATNLDRILEGYITEARIYNRALSQPEIQALYNLSQPSGTEVKEKQVPGQNEGGVSRYSFNGDVTDSWGSNDAVDNTSVGFSNGVYGSAKKFDSTGSLDTTISLSTTFTLATWLKAEKESDDYHQFLNTTTSNSGNGIYLEKPPDGTFRAVTKSSDTITVDIRSEELIRDRWAHCLVTYDGSKLRQHLDGKLINEASLSNLLHDTSLSVSNYLGRMDELRIYNTALKPQQVEKLYHKGAYRIPRRSTLQ